MTLNEFKSLNKSIGNHWFSTGAVNFFDSKIHDWDEKNGVFITSEDSHIGGSKRMFTIRVADFETGRVRTPRRFMEFDSLREARTVMKRIIISRSYE